MDKLIEVLYSCIINPQCLSQGSSVLKEWEVQAGYSATLSKILHGSIQLPPQIPESMKFFIRQFSGILLKNFISDYWSESSHISPQDMRETRQVLMQCIKIDDPKLKNLAVLALSGIVLRDFPDQWPLCFDNLLQLAEGNDLVTINSILPALGIIFDECDDRLSRATHLIFPALYKFFNQAVAHNSAQTKEKCLSVASKCLESLSWADGVDQELISSSLDSSWSNWFYLLLEILGSEDSTIEMKRLSLKMLTTFFRDFTTYSFSWYYLVIQPTWTILHQLVPLYQANVVYSKEILINDELENETEGVEGLTIQLLELITSLIIRPVIGPQVVGELKALVNTLAWYLPLTAEQEDLWSNDPNQFISEEDNEEYLKSSRTSCLKLISALVDLFGDASIECIVSAVESILRSISQESSAPLLYSSNEDIQNISNGINQHLQEIVKKFSSQHIWKAKEAAVLLLGSISTDIIGYNSRARKAGKQPLEVANFFGSVILSDLAGNESKNPFLKGRALWCAAKLSDIMDANHPDCVNIFRICCNALNAKEPIAVRLSACYAILKLSRKSASSISEINEILPNLLVNLVALIQRCSPDILHLVLDTFQEVLPLNSDISSTVPQYASGIFLKLFSKHYGESSLISKIFAIIRYWCDLGKCMGSLLDVFLPFVMSLFTLYPATSKEKPGSMSSNSTMGSQVESLLILPSSLELMTLFLKKSNAESSERRKIMDIIEPLLDLLGRTEDISILLQGTNCLRAFCGFSAEEVLKRGLDEKIIETVASLLNPLKNEAGALGLGYLVIQVFSKISPKIDEDLLIGCLNKLHRCKMPSIVQGLVLVFARLIHSHSAEILGFLSSLTVERRVGLKVLLDKWLIHQPLIRGRYTKNATIAALARIYTLKDQAVESLLVVGYNPSHSNVGSEVLAPFKILSTLIRCLDNEAFMPKRKQQEEIGLNEEFQTVVEGSGLGFIGDYEEPGERMDTIEDDKDSVQEDRGEREDPMESLKNDLLKEIKEDYDVRDFQIPVSKDKGLGDYETGSECLMSDMLDFDYEDNDDINDDINEDDMYSLGDWYGGITLQTFLLDFFNNLITNDKEYLLACMKHLLAEDIALFKKHFTF
ncbi:unnamed protein product [Blepharisma stoltei]|uniref:Importin N-terminal domain-containing protein n=1 Tax=Blepharisma stoltei TaxID=1481888 RepID=A0AAU9JP07_9CILI|nr:unnamed protein product [Blepharisma stoltei]